MVFRGERVTCKRGKTSSDALVSNIRTVLKMSCQSCAYLNTEDVSAPIYNVARWGSLVGYQTLVQIAVQVLPSLNDGS